LRSFVLSFLLALVAVLALPTAALAGVVRDSIYI
jgi:hypothetical protein